MTPADQQEVAVHLHEALDHLIAGLMLAEGLPNSTVPGEALDVALRATPAFREARQGLQQALQGIHDHAVVLAVEEAANALAARAAEVGFRLGVRVRG